MLTRNFSIYAIPGWGFSSEILSPLATNGLSIIGLDYFKLAESSLESIAKRFVDIIPNNATLLGWSFGGLIAIKIAALFPKKVRKLILISSQPKFLSTGSWQGIQPNVGINFIKRFRNNPENQISRFINLVSYPSRKTINKKFLSQHFVTGDIDKLLLLLRTLFNADLRKSYQSLIPEILHVINKEDGVIQQNEVLLKGLNPKINAVSLKKLGHAGFLDDCISYQNIIKDFLFR